MANLNQSGISEWKVWDRLQACLAAARGDSTSAGWATLKQWQQAFGKPLCGLEQVQAALASENDMYELLLALGSVAPHTPQACRAMPAAELELLLCLTLVSAEALARGAEPVRCQAEAALLQVGITAPLAAAMVGACWFGVDLHLARSDQAAGGLVATNVINGLSVLELGVTDAARAVDAELFAAYKTFGAPSGERRHTARRLKEDSAVPLRAVIKVALRKLLREQQVQFMLALPQGEARVLEEAPDVVKALRSDCGVNVLSFSTAAAPEEEWAALQANMLSLVIEPVLEKIFAGPSLPKKDTLIKAKLFISYAHEDDKQWIDLLKKHLGVLVNQDLLEIWDDSRIGAGERWRVEIEKAMESSAIGVFMISAGFFNSKFIAQQEVPTIMERYELGGMHIMPILVEHCAWREHTWIKEIHMQPGTVPLEELKEKEDRNKAMTEITQEIAKIIRKVQR